MSAPSQKPERWLSVLLCSIYLAFLVPATPLALIGLGWIGASDRGWWTQAAAGALVAGWLALVVGSVSMWKAAKRAERPNLLVAVASAIAAIASYTVTYEWGGRMLI